MNKILTDFYMWMQENDYDHNIRARVEKKAEIYLNSINVGQKLPKHNVSNNFEYIRGYKDGWRDCCKNVKEFR